MKQLDDYFDAYDRAHDLAQAAPDWGILRSHVRRALARPALKLAGSALLLIAGLALGVFGHPSGYLLAAGVLLAVLPDRIRRVRSNRRRFDQLEDIEDLREHLLRTARLERAGAFVSALLHAGATVLFLITGLIAGLLGKDFRPGLIAGLLVAGLSAYHLLVRLPRISRECRALGEGSGRTAELEDGGEES